LALAKADLAKVNKKIEEELKRLATAQADKDQADSDFNAEETRWAAEVAAHEDLLSELESELDALSQCIDLFSSPEMQDVGDEMLGRLNQL
jgi:septal ring factor EnvC (AmiA/AmiB activator)